MTPEALVQLDADHRVDELYGAAEDIGASSLTAVWSRYVVDLNRPSDDSPLYPGQIGSGLVPTERFDGALLYRQGLGPDPSESANRVERYWRPYHMALERLIDGSIQRHGYCLLWDCHSIDPISPRLFEGRLPDLNLGSFDGRACPSGLAQAVFANASAGPGLTSVLDGRFKGGFITRHYGQPGRKVFALQLELSYSTYLQDGPPHADGPVLDPDRVARLKPVLRSMLEAFLNEAPRHV
jgi:N-formylglutamate deformylase